MSTDAGSSSSGRRPARLPGSSPVSRRDARTRAVEVLFEAEQRGLSTTQVLSWRREQAETVFPPYAITLIEGVLAYDERILEIMGTYSSGWAVDRMPAVDRQILRLGVFELLWADDVPDAVAIDEAVELAKSLSTDESPSFVNGLLGRVLRMKPALLG